MCKMPVDILLNIWYNIYSKERKDLIQLNKNYYLMLDTETANGLDCPLVYDIGFAVIDKKGNVYESYSFIVYDIFCQMKDIMQTAYYKNKIPQYERDLAEGRRKIATYKTIKMIIARLCKKYNIVAIVAHNAPFDYKSTNITQRYLTKSKYRYFFPYGIPIWCTLTMARQTIAKQPTYITWCKLNGFTTKNGTVKLTAEILYRFITQDIEFKESHTGLEDVLIEKEIFVRILRQHKKIKRSPYRETA